MRLRAAAQQAARKHLIQKYNTEYDEIYRKEVTRLFKENGLGEPEFRDA